MPTLGLAVIARDEEVGLPLAISSVRGLVDEVVVALDTRTTDGTRAAAGTARVIDIPFLDFAQMRNAAIRAMTTDWVLMIDADEILEGDPRPLLLGAPCIWEFPRRHWKDLQRTIPAADDRFYPDRQGRLFPNDPRLFFERPVHELARGFPRRRTSDVTIHHLKEALRSPALLEERRRLYDSLVEQGRAAGHRFRAGKD